MTVTREEFDAALTSVRELTETVAQITADLKIQFERIAQMQAELDSLRIAAERRQSRKKKSAPMSPGVAADQPDERRSRPR
jgi:hypothetical protein